MTTEITAATDTARIDLYESNAGQLTIIYRGAAYLGIEHADCGFADLAAILLGDLDGEVVPADPDIDGDGVTDLVAETREMDELIAIHSGGRVTVEARPGSAGCLCLGIDE